MRSPRIGVDQFGEVRAIGLQFGLPCLAATWSSQYFECLWPRNAHHADTATSKGRGDGDDSVIEVHELGSWLLALSFWLFLACSYFSSRGLQPRGIRSLTLQEDCSGRRFSRVLANSEQPKAKSISSHQKIRRNKEQKPHRDEAVHGEEGSV